MTTAFEEQVQSDVYGDLKAEGVFINVPFLFSDGAVEDTDNSTVTPGLTRTETGECLPPEAYREAVGTAIGSDGQSTGEARAGLLRLYLMTAVGTPSAISWEPFLGQVVTLYGVNWRIDKVSPIATGDDVLMYACILEK